MSAVLKSVYVSRVERALLFLLPNSSFGEHKLQSQDEDSMLICLSNSQDVDSMSMCQSNSHCDAVVMVPLC
jgi:hypothetical protein